MHDAISELKRICFCDLSCCCCFCEPFLLSELENDFDAGLEWSWRPLAWNRQMYKLAWGSCNGYQKFQANCYFQVRNVARVYVRNTQYNTLRYDTSIILHCVVCLWGSLQCGKQFVVNMLNKVFFFYRTKLGYMIFI